VIAHPFDVLREGADILLDVLLVHGFEVTGPYWEHPELTSPDDVALVGYGRGENDAREDLVCGDRRLELALYYRLRPPTYVLGGVRIGHAALMRGAGCDDPAYPPYSADPLEGFRALARDLARCGGSFVAG
jgi:hypothetical protein